MQDRATNIELIRRLDYESVKSLCQGNRDIRRVCLSNFWRREAINLGLSPEQVADIFTHKPDYVSNAVYFKWLEMWGLETSVGNFVNVSRGGLLPLVKLYAYLGVDVHHNREQALLDAASKGHLDVVQWLYSLGGISRNDINWILQSAATSGHLNIVQWVYSLGGVDREAIDCGFIGAATSGHLNVVQWLYSMCGVSCGTIDYALSDIVDYNCKCVDVIDWLNDIRIGL